MAKSKRNDRFYDDEYGYDEYPVKKKEKTPRREDKRKAKLLPCEKED